MRLGEPLGEPSRSGEGCGFKVFTTEHTEVSQRRNIFFKFKPRHCEERRDVAIQETETFWIASPAARNDDFIHRIVHLNDYSYSSVLFSVISVCSVVKLLLLIRCPFPHRCY